jgi:hypothetical protein
MLMRITGLWVSELLEPWVSELPGRWVPELELFWALAGKANVIAKTGTITRQKRVEGKNLRIASSGLPHDKRTYEEAIQ